MEERMAKEQRILDIYSRLCEGKTINKDEEAWKYGVNERSIQRDIDDIRAFLDSPNSDRNGSRKISYDRKRKGFVMTGEGVALMENSEILAVSKILLESRAFTKAEMKAILDKLIAGCVPQQNMKLVSDLLANERHHYVELHHKSQMKKILWEVGSAVRGCNLMELQYHRQTDPEHQRVKRVVEPVAILFSDYYFYLAAYLVKQKEGSEGWEALFDYPAIFRIDRIEHYSIKKEHFKIPYQRRFEDGEFRKRVQFMYPGELMKVRFRYTGPSVEAVLDRLPTAKICGESKDGYEIQAEVYGTGIEMWLLSQGPWVEVLYPKSLRERMKEKIGEMMECYKE